MALSRRSVTPEQMRLCREVALTLAERGTSFVLAEHEFAGFMDAVHAGGTNTHLADQVKNRGIRWLTHDTPWPVTPRAYRDAYRRLTRELTHMYVAERTALDACPDYSEIMELVIAGREAEAVELARQFTSEAGDRWRDELHRHDWFQNADFIQEPPDAVRPHWPHP